MIGKVCAGCGFGMATSMIGDNAFCANCSCQLAIFKRVKSHRDTGEFILPNQKRKQTSQNPSCVCCGKPACSLQYDFRFDDARTHVEYPVCRKHFIGIYSRNLDKKAFLAIKEFAQHITFNIHDDFYTDAGCAVHPKFISPKQNRGLVR